MEISIASSIESRKGLRRYNLAQGYLTPAWWAARAKDPMTRDQRARRRKAKAAKLARRNNRP